MIINEEQIYYREDTVFQKSKLTIENQLHRYESHPVKSERSATLWHAWHQNKSWLTRLLELTLSSFPSYSRHNASHAEAVLYNIERILGEYRIAQLSATDCFAILHTVYVHDIGMAILAEDRKRIVMSDEFVEMVDEFAEGADEDLKAAALQLKQLSFSVRKSTIMDYDGIEYHEEKKRLYNEKLEAYYAIIQLLAEYQRKHHGEKAASRVKDWISDGDKLRSEFAMSGIPMRIFLRIADCASLHTDWDFQHVLELPEEENGYENDMLHPRFVAVLLQLGDALDIDNDRFHPFAQAFLDKFPMQSQAHYDKHLAIRTLKITPEEIQIEADCRTRESLRLVRNECDGLETLLQQASYHWSSIAPKGFSGALPSFKPPKLLLSGKEIPLDLAMMRFQISQRKAFSLLQGENIYSGSFPFVRELLQNAIDSTKIQCYLDYISSSKFRFTNSRETIKPPAITELSQIINPVEYPIVIKMQCYKICADRQWKMVDIEKIPEEESEDETYGILFSIKDYGTGINTETLRAISNVGMSHKEKKKLIMEMPDWLRPTGEFGIGLQSVFLVTDKFYCDTFVRNGERYRIEFITGANGEKGHINVEPRDVNEHPMAYGTEFQVFIGHDKKKIRSEFMNAWPGYDPFSEDYAKGIIQRDIIALTTQILLDIDEQLENLLFPVYASVEFDMGDSCRKQLENNLSKIVFDNFLGERRKYQEQYLKEKVSWLYNQNINLAANSNISRFGIEGGICLVNLERMQVNLWLSDISVNVRIGVERLLYDSFQVKTVPCKIYYKGILIKIKDIEGGLGLLESIDIQGGLRGKNLIQLSRNGFTKEGEDYINETLVPKIFQKFYEALRIMAIKKYTENEFEFAEVVGKNIQIAINKVISGEIHEDNWKRQLLGVSLFYNFYMLKSERRNEIYVSGKILEERNQWYNALTAIREAVNEKRQALYAKRAENVINNLWLNDIKADLETKDFQVMNKRTISIADFFLRKDKFIILSKRRDQGDKWINYLVRLNGDGLKMLMDMLEANCHQNDEIMAIQSKLEKWSQFLLENMESIMEPQTVQQSDYLAWLLHSVPIAGCFSDLEGNMKLHLLSGKTLGGVYYNTYAKFRLLKKMAIRNAKTNARRFAGKIWWGYEALAVEKIQEDICNVKEEYVYDNENFMVYPCLSETMNELIDFAEGTKELTNDRKALIEIGDELLSCVVLEYGKCKKMYEEFFNQQFKTNFERNLKVENVTIREYSFWEQLSGSYRILLQTCLHNAVAAKVQKEQGVIEEKEYDAMNEERRGVPDIETVRENRRKIYHAVLAEEESLFKGEWGESDKSDGDSLKDLAEGLIDDCIAWKEKWDQLENDLMNNKMQKIKDTFIREFSCQTNLIKWTVEASGNEEETVNEEYNYLFEQLCDAAAQYRRAHASMGVQCGLLEWIEQYGR